MSYRENLKSQIYEEYAKVTYSYTCHWIHVDRLVKCNSILKKVEIVLTSVTATAVISYLCVPKKWLLLISAIISAISIAVSIILQSTNYDELITKHRKMANDLWLIREKYLCLLTDFDQLSEEQITLKRDDLTQSVSDINVSELPTNQKDYKKAQKKLKNEEYQFFSSEEIDKMLPKYLRKNN
ncbi:SLATT domain-containing protein [Absicoccus porci]|uniref:SLATT domain-containing protein n=1 Tax=Absicoccus porci TaxID=2486576 RepID=UPI0029434152|nr:SLATT domain-containing protein [Absicoccus porci]